MNKDRRKQLEKIRGDIEVAKDALESVLSDEQSAFDNMPEGLQGSDKGEAMSGGLDQMQEAVDSLGSAFDNIEEALQQ